MKTVKIDVYYDERRVEGSEYPCKRIEHLTKDEFLTIMNSDSKYIQVADEESHHVYLMKDRIVEFWIHKDD